MWSDYICRTNKNDRGNDRFYEFIYHYRDLYRWSSLPYLDLIHGQLHIHPYLIF